MNDEEFAEEVEATNSPAAKEIEALKARIAELEIKAAELAGEIAWYQQCLTAQKIKFDASQARESKLRDALENIKTSPGGICRLLAEEALALPHDSSAQDFCYCNDDISLQAVSGGAASEGLYGRVTLKVGEEYVKYYSEKILNMRGAGAME
jgi:uncharacterized coiled-coil protein SlyX